MLARAVSIPASWTGPNRPASLPAVVLGATGASVNRALPASARTRSIPVGQSWPASCAVAIPSSSWPPVNPRARCLIGPIPRSSAPTIPNRAVTSSTAANPASAVSDPSGAPIRTRRAGRLADRFLPRSLLTEQVPFTGRPGSAVPERADRPRGDRRAVRRHPRRGAGRLPAVAAVAAVPGAPARTVPRYTRADLLQVRGRVAGRVPQAEHCGAAGVLQRAGGRAAAHHRDRRGAGGQRSGVRRGALRAALRGVDGAGVVRPKAVPPLDDAGVRRDGARQPVEGDQLRTGDPRREPGLARPKLVS